MYGSVLLRRPSVPGDAAGARRAASPGNESDWLHGVVGVRGLLRAAPWLLLLAVATASAEQVCDTSTHPLSSPTERFVDHDDGTVTDEVTMLMWLRCSAGQAWTEGRCEGTATLHDWHSAQAVVGDVNEGGKFFFNDWRIPSLRELASIAERECQDPRVNLTVFPDTPAGSFWTTSSRSGGDGERFYALSFGAEGVSLDPKRQKNFVRLVRFAP